MQHSGATDATRTEKLGPSRHCVSAVSSSSLLQAGCPLKPGRHSSAMRPRGTVQGVNPQLSDKLVDLRLSDTSSSETRVESVEIFAKWLPDLRRTNS